MDPSNASSEVSMEFLAEIIPYSVILRDMKALWPNETRTLVTLPIANTILVKVKEWCRSFPSEQATGKAEDWGKRYDANVRFKNWEQQFMDRNKELLIEMIHAANFLEMTILLDDCAQKAAHLIEKEELCSIGSLSAELQQHIAHHLMPHSLHKAATAGIVPLTDAMKKHNSIWRRVWKSDEPLRASVAAGANPILVGQFDEEDSETYVCVASMDFTGEWSDHLPDHLRYTSVESFLQDNSPGANEGEVVMVEDYGADPRPRPDAGPPIQVCQGEDHEKTFFEIRRLIRLILADQQKRRRKLTVNFSGWFAECAYVSNAEELLVRRDSEGVRYIEVMYLKGPQVHRFRNLNEPNGRQDLRCTEALHPYNGKPIDFTIVGPNAHEFTSLSRQDFKEMVRLARFEP